MERRKHDRFEVTVPMCMETGTGWTFVTMSRNASRTGLLVITAATLEVGELVKVVLQPGSSKSTESKLEGQIVRVESSPKPLEEGWPTEVAVEFNTEQPEIQEVLESYIKARE